MTSCPLTPITFADTVSGSCLAVCNSTYYGVNSTRTCASTCPNSMFADPLTRMCVIQCDPVLNFYGDANLAIPKCVSLCSLGSFSDPYTQTCVTSCHTYPQMYGFDNGFTNSSAIRACVYSCPYPYVADNATFKCKISCTNSSLPYIDQASQSCVSACTSPIYQYLYMPIGSTVNGTCVKFCPNGTFALLTNKSCVSVCPNNTYGSTTNNTCMSSCILANN